MSVFKIVLGLSVAIYALGACKPSHESAEKGFLQIQPLHATTSIPIAYCFDQIYGLGQANWSPTCVDSGSIFNLPLNISADSCLFVLVKKKRYDTILVKYHRQTSFDNEEYTVIYPSISVTGNTFPRSNTNCPNNNCDAQNFILYLYF
jgi:hypothetical protein